MEIDLGKPVISSDGKRVGSVDRLVLDANTKEVRQFIIHQGTILTQDRLVDRPFIERVDDDGTLHLNATAEMVNQLPPFVESEFVIPTEEDLQYLPQAWVGPAATGGPILWASGTYGQGYDRDASLFDPAPMNPPTVETRSNLGEDTIVIDEGTNVVDSKGKKIGTVDEIVYDEDGNMAGFVVKAGFIVHHDVRVPASWVESITPESVQLTVTADEADQSSAS